VGQDLGHRYLCPVKSRSIANPIPPGSIRDAARVWAVNELEPEQARLLHNNDWLGEEVVSFRPHEIPAQV
jgi:hypothetical protein